MGTNQILRLVGYGIAATLSFAFGSFLINTLSLPLMDPGTTLSVAFSDALRAVAVGALIEIPIGFLYFALVTSLKAALRPFTWWAGAISGLIPSGLYALFIAYVGGSTRYIASPDELATLEGIRISVMVLIVISATVSAAILAVLFRPRQATGPATV